MNDRTTTIFGVLAGIAQLIGMIKPSWQHITGWFVGLFTAGIGASAAGGTLWSKQ